MVQRIPLQCLQWYLLHHRVGQRSHNPSQRKPLWQGRLPHSSSRVGVEGTWGSHTFPFCEAPLEDPWCSTMVCPQTGLGYGSSCDCQVRFPISSRPESWGPLHRGASTHLQLVKFWWHQPTACPLTTSDRCVQ